MMSVSLVWQKLLTVMNKAISMNEHTSLLFRVSGGVTNWQSFLHSDELTHRKQFAKLFYCFTL